MFYCRVSEIALYNSKMARKSGCCRCLDASLLVPRGSSLDALAAGAPRHLNHDPSAMARNACFLARGNRHALSNIYVPIAPIIIKWI